MVHYPQINVIHHIDKVKDKNHVIISVDAERAFDKIQHHGMNFQQTGYRGNILIKTTYEKPIANIILSGDKLKAFFLRSGI